MLDGAPRELRFGTLEKRKAHCHIILRNRLPYLATRQVLELAEWLARLQAHRPERFTHSGVLGRP